MTRIQAMVFALLMCGSMDAAEPIHIGSQLELLIDDHLVASTKGGVRLQMHRPVRRNVAVVTDNKWEGNACTYTSVFQDGDRYRMYFGSLHYVMAKGKLIQGHPPFTCYAESRDGIHWTKPDLGLVEFEGSSKNNIVLTNGSIPGLAVDAAHIAVFKDSNPKCPPAERYKALIRSRATKGLFALKSPDGLRISRNSSISGWVTSM